MKIITIILLSVFIFISCKQKDHCGIYVGNEKLGLDNYWRKVTGYDSLQIYCNAGDKLDYNFCYPNEWQFKKFKRDTCTTQYGSRCKIKKIGKVYKEKDGTMVVSGWSFDCSEYRNDFISSGVPPCENVLAGWGVTQLELISQFQDTGLFTPDTFHTERWVYKSNSVDIGYGSDTIYTREPLFVPDESKKKKK